MKTAILYKLSVNQQPAVLCNQIFKMLRNDLSSWLLLNIRHNMCLHHCSPLLLQTLLGCLISVDIRSCAMYSTYTTLYIMRMYKTVTVEKENLFSQELMSLEVCFTLSLIYSVLPCSLKNNIQFQYNGNLQSVTASL